VIVRVVRHACAGRKGDWPGPDADRPLDPAGCRQADAVAAALAPGAGRAVRRLVSSPARRCVDTLAVLSRAAGLPIETTDVLTAEAPLDAAMAAVVDPANGDAVLCTHGELMRRMLACIRAGDASVVAARPDDDWLLVKAGVWTLHVVDGAVSALHHSVPAGVVECATHRPS
jgi:phosphohistidine phosphatase SixA